MSDEPQAWQDQLTRIEKVIAAQEELRGIVPDEQITAALAPLQAQRAELVAKIEGSGVAAQGVGNTAVGPQAIQAADSSIGGSAVTGTVTADGDFVGGDQVKIIMQVAADFWQQLDAPPPDLEAATEGYLTYLLTKYRYLDFKGMGVSDRAPLRLPLLKMYVPLQARIEMPEGETWTRDLYLAGRQMSQEEAEAVGPHMSEPQPVLTLLQENAGLIILGDPGAGKTTFLKYLALQLAQGNKIGLGHRLPVLLPLSAYATALAQKDIALDAFVKVYYQELLGDDMVGALLMAALQEGKALLLLDGLDEVKAVGQRRLVVNRVEHFFARQTQRGNKFVLTSRIVGYREVRPTADGLAECTLVDFDEIEIEQFVTQWTTAIEEAAQGETQVAAMAAKQEQTGLLQALQHNTGVKRLAANPLLLTILALMKRQGVTLPQRRVELYEQYVRTLLKHWNLARGLDRPPSRDLDVVETVRVLAPLALWMHQTNPGIGLVKQQALRRQLIQIYQERGWEQSETAANQLLEDARDYAGLLVERGQGMFGFIHLTFQEYLAGVAIAQMGQRTLQPVVDILAQRLEDDNWHEVILLAIGYLGIVQQRDEAASEVLTQLVVQAPGTPGQAEIIAGEAVADTWPGGVTRPCREAMQQALLAAMQDDTRVQVPQRAKAGQVLLQVGEPRIEVLDIDAMRLCYVPSGPFWMGSETGPASQKPQHWLELNQGYWLGQYPVTNAQYEAFIKDGGYRQEAYWSEAKEAGHWLAGIIRARSCPDYRYLSRLSNQPVVGINWYEGVAFTRWLTKRWQEMGWLLAGWQVRLPSEAMWEKGARGGVQVPLSPIIQTIKMSGRQDMQPTVESQPNDRCQTPYSWGDDPNPNRANYDKSELDTTNPVGCFPGGITPYGVEEMLGNVHEWTSSKDAVYEYRGNDGREAIDTSDHSRIMRGGSFTSDDAEVRCTSRRSIHPLGLSRYGGIRVCVSPINYNGA